MQTRSRTRQDEANREGNNDGLFSPAVRYRLSEKQMQELEGLRRPTPASEFGGVLGTSFLTIGLPVVLLWVWASIECNSGHLLGPKEWSIVGVNDFFIDLYHKVRMGATPTWRAFIVYFAWFLFQAALQHFVPGKEVLGSTLPGGFRLKYWLNGWLCWWISMALVPTAWFFGVPLTILYDNYGPMITIVIIWSYVMTFMLKAHALLKDEEERMSGWFPYDYWMGFARNPRIGTFDLKLFCEARPGLILWVLMNFSIAAKQYDVYGEVSLSMILVCVFHAWYIADYYYHEEAILTTMDIITEKFGFMLVFGDLAWVPFTYCFQAFYLLKHNPGGQPLHISYQWAAVIVCLKVLGYYLFRWVNSQKHEFRRHADEPTYTLWGEKPTFIQTKRGTKLLTSGFWGKARHLNYTGDIILAWTWCLPCGFDALAPYFYGIYFTSLDLHRCWRDHHECKKKYGDDWERYCRKVPHVFVPGLF